jgi:hypothetical protein
MVLLHPKEVPLCLSGKVSKICITVLHRDTIIAMAAQHRLPAVYPYRFYALSGGLVSGASTSFCLLPPEATCLARCRPIGRPRLFKHRAASSQKPDEAYELIERMYPDLPKIELFARQTRLGRAAWGNEIAKSA